MPVHLAILWHQRHIRDLGAVWRSPWPRSLLMPRVRQPNDLKPCLRLCAKCLMPLSVTGCGWLRRRRSPLARTPSARDRGDERPMIAVQMMSRNPLPGRPKRSAAWSNINPNAPAFQQPAVPPQTLRHFNRSIPALSATPFPHSSSVATGKASGWPVRQRGGSAGFSYSRTPHCRSQECIASRQDAQRSFRPTGSNSTWRTATIRSSPIWDR
jgi:hypothetical protein